MGKHAGLRHTKELKKQIAGPKHTLYPFSCNSFVVVDRLEALGSTTSTDIWSKFGAAAITSWGEAISMKIVDFSLVDGLRRRIYIFQKPKGHFW